MQDEYLYRAFISYSHRDAKWAKWLLSALEGYRVPQDIEAPTGGKLPPKLGKFFRDRDDASAATNLAAEIRTALNASQNLIVIASPASARSAYVEQEIRDFAALNAGRAQPGLILTLVADGAPAISKGQDPADGECFPWALRGGLTLADGTVMEPLAADARKTGDGKTRALAKLVSGLLGIRYDSLVRRDLQRQRQRRIWATAAGVALLASVAGAGLKIESDRQDKLELQRQQQQAAREEALMRAVNTAERAKGFLERGNTRMALTLAQKSRRTAENLPFIPQVYDVLFTAHVQQARPVTVEIGPAGNGKSFHFPIGNGEYLSADGMWSAKIWSPMTGVTFARADVDTGTLDPAMAQDRSMILFKGNDLSNLHRFWLQDRTWDKVSYTDLSFDDFNPTALVALDGDTMVGCAAKGLFGATLPPKGSDGAQAELTWQLPLPQAGCLSLAAVDKGQVLAGTDKGEVLAIDLGNKTITARYRLKDGDWPYAISVAGRRFKVTGTRLDYVFEMGKAEPLLVTDSSPALMLSPDGARAITPDPGGRLEGRYILHDLTTGTQAAFSCTCRPTGFDGDGNLISNDREGAMLRDGSDGKVLRPLFTFPRAVDDLRYLAQDNLLAGLRNVDPATVISLKRAPVKPLARAPMDGRRLLSQAQFLDDAEVAVVWNASTLVGLENLQKGVSGASYSLALYPARPEGDVEPRYRFGPVNAYIGAEVAGHGLLFLTLQEKALSWPRRAIVLDPAQDKTVFDGPVLSPLVKTGVGDKAIIETEEDLLLLDLASRKVVTSGIAKGAVPRFRFWSLHGTTLHAANEQTLKGVDFSSDPPRPLPDIALGGYGNFICHDAASDSLFMINVQEKRAFYQRWSLLKGELLDELELKPERQDAFQVIADAEVWIDRQQYAETVGCDGAGLTIRDRIGKAVRWDVAGKTISVNAEAATAPAPSDDAIDPPPTADELAVAGFGFTEKAAELRSSDGRLLVRFDADGARFVSGDYMPRRGIVTMGLENGELRAWDVRHPDAPIISLKLHESAIKALDASPDETRVMTADLGGTIYVLPLPEMDALERMVAADH